MQRIEIKNLPPDLYSRNTVITFLAEKLLGGQSAGFVEDGTGLRVLDVGGYGGQLHAFFPGKADFTVLDKLPAPAEEMPEKAKDQQSVESKNQSSAKAEAANLHYRQADAQKIPFSDRNFDLVVSTDMLEHVDISERAPVIREMLRVSKNYLILGMPCQSALTERAEQEIMEQFQEITGQQHPFLKEHQDFGLPDEEKIESILAKEGVQFFKIKEGNLMNWYIQQLYAGLRSGEDMGEKQQGFYQFFNEHLRELGNLRSPAYRTLFVIAKEGVLPENEIREALEAQHGWNPERFMELLRKAFGDLWDVLSKKRITQNDYEQIKRKHEEERLHAQHQKNLVNERDALLIQKQAQINQKEAQVAEKEQRLAKAREVVNQHREAILEVRNFLQEKEKALNLLRLTLQQTSEELKKEKATSAQLNREMESLQETMVAMETLLQGKNEELKGWLEESRATLQQTQSLLQTTQAELENHQRELRSILQSRAWKLVMFYSKVKHGLVRLVPLTVRNGIKVLFQLGIKEFLRRTRLWLKKRALAIKMAVIQGHTKTSAAHPSAQSPQLAYTAAWRTGALEEAKKQIPTFDYQPVISIIVPVYNISEELLKKAVESVKNQVYEKWELCLCDDASTQKHVRPMLEKLARKDHRIKVAYRQENGGIVKASNDALKLATGAYVGFLDNDDELTPDALFEVVKALQKTRYDFLYSDEDKLDMEGNLCDAFFKPDFSPDLLMSINYICHFAVYRHKLLTDVGGLREGFDGSQDYDLVLRVTEKTKNIHHIPKILYHWRKIPGSTAAEVEGKPYVFDAAKKALQQAAKRRGEKVEVTDGIWKGSYRVHRKITQTPLVSMIIPFKDKPEILKTCYESIVNRSTYQNYELLLIDNRSEQPETAEYLKTLEGAPRVRIIQYDHPFNFSAINNYAAKLAKGSVLILLNNDTEVIAPDWIEAMLEHAQRPQVGAVGAKLLYPNGLVQHAGVLIGVGGIANHAFLKAEKHSHGYFGQTSVVRNYSAVTGACMMVRKEVYLDKMGGLNEKELAVGFNDVDFCLRLREKGYTIVYTPYALLYHYESLTRGYEVNMKEVQYIQHRHHSILENGDPYHSPNLSKDRFDFS